MCVGGGGGGGGGGSEFSVKLEAVIVKLETVVFCQLPLDLAGGGGPDWGTVSLTISVKFEIVGCYQLWALEESNLIGSGGGGGGE